LESSSKCESLKSMVFATNQFLDRRGEPTRASAAVQGDRPTILAEPRFAKTKWHWDWQPATSR
jgi:hypothetical protein